MQYIVNTIHSDRKGYHYNIQLIEDNSYYQGVILIDGLEIYRSTKSKAEANVKRWLNMAIDRRNIQYEIRPKLPNVRYDTPRPNAKNPKPREVKLEPKADKPTAQTEENPMPATETKPAQANIAPAQPTATETAKTAPKSTAVTKPKRKPFTPYGLNGYLVDKQGNVRLMLDRRASAKTIVLNPEMFSALADMVRKTQEQ